MPFTVTSPPVTVMLPRCLMFPCVAASVPPPPDPPIESAGVFRPIFAAEVSSSAPPAVTLPLP